jgi:hypothetical protein
VEIPTLAAIEDALAARGLRSRGAFHLEPDDGVATHAGVDAGTLVLAGQVGASHWERFARERRSELERSEPDPLDRWSARALDAIARRFGARVILPGDGPPYPPFQRWAQRAEAVHVSPLGLLIHPEHGLWHAYRGALVFGARLALPPRDARPSPCAACRDRPCLAACPVAAFGAGGFDAASCVGHLRSGHGAACFDAGCLARAACPVGRELRYPPEVARFHLAAFERQMP